MSQGCFADLYTGKTGVRRVRVISSFDLDFPQDPYLLRDISSVKAAPTQ